jgi:hypothetical protein
MSENEADVSATLSCVLWLAGSSLIIPRRPGHWSTFRPRDSNDASTEYAAGVDSHL